MTDLHDLEAERATLGACLVSRDAYGQIAWLRPDDWFDPRHSLIWAAMQRLVSTMRPIDMLMLRAELGDSLRTAGGLEYVAELSLSVPSSASVEHYAGRVSEMSAQRRLQSALANAVRLVGTMPSGDVAEVALQSVMASQVDRGTDHGVEMFQAASEAWASIGATAEPGVMTGFNQLDSTTLGFQKGELTILAARPAIGKSSMALDIACRAAQRGKRVRFASLEMKCRALMLRMIASESGIDGHYVRSGKMTTEQFSEGAQAADRISRLPLTIDDYPTQTIASLMTSCRRQQISRGLDMVVVDYLQLCTAAVKGSRVEQITEISNGLRAMARHLDVPVLALSQLSRECEKEGRLPRLSDLRDSGTIEQDADVVLFLHRKERERPETVLMVAKNRNGAVKNIDLVFDPQFTTFRESPRTM